MSSYVLGFQEIDQTKHMVVGGKGANLGELSKLEGIRVPDGFCVSTEALQRVMGRAPAIVSQRKAEHERNGKLAPPRVLTSDGEIVAGAYKRAGLPAGALIGLPAASI